MANQAQFWEALNKLFSVVCQIDAQGFIVQASDLLTQRIPLAGSNRQKFFELFEFKRPTAFDGSYQNARDQQGHLFLGYNMPNGFAIRGQVLDFSDQGLLGLCFVGVPWLWWIQSNAPDATPSLTDFPIHDVQMDQLFFMSTQQAMVEDLQAVNAALTQAKQELEDATQAKHRYFNHISHEMRTPLNGVMSALTLLQDANWDARNRELLDLAAQSAQRLLEVVNYTLNVGASEVGQQLGRQEAFNLNGVLNESIATVRAKALHKGIDVQRHGQAQFPTDYQGKLDLLRPVLSNLLANAVKFSEEGTVTLEVHIEESRLEGTDLVHFAVIDEGPGIPEALFPRLFEPFATGLTPETQKQHGTGLGLSIVKQFVDALGGEIDVQSVMDQGSVFSFSIPLERIERVSQSQHGSHPRDLAFTSVDVLVVDDTPSNLMLNSNIVGSLGFKVTSASSGQEAVELIRANPDLYALVLLDLEMPELDGWDTCKQIRALVSNEQLPVIALSTHVGEDVVRQNALAGINGYIAKPLHREALAAALRQWIPRCQQLDLQEYVAAQDAALSASAIHDARPVVDETIDSPSMFAPEVFSRLVDEIGIDSAVAMFQTFLSESATRWVRLQSAIAGLDWECVAREGHTLGSACYTFGLMAAGAQFRAIEVSAEAQEAISLHVLDTVSSSLREGIEKIEIAIERGTP